MTSGFEIMLPVFITTLGPLKVIPVFYAMTRTAPFRYRAELALRATIEASLVIGFVALVASGKMEQLHISHDAIAIAGGMILFVTRPARHQQFHPGRFAGPSAGGYAARRA